MSWVIYLFGSGAAFFVGVGLVLASVGLTALPRRKWSDRIVTIFALVGMILIAISATPLPYLFYLAAGVATLTWLVVEKSWRDRCQRWRRGLRIGVVALWLLGTMLEIPYHIAPALTAKDRPTLYIIGDSVTAGLSEKEPDTWPHLLTRSWHVEVRNLSQAGATAASALRQAQALPAEGGLVLLEIGGNDLLGSTTATAFERDLDDLLNKVCSPGRTVLMFELPLPPFCNEYGLVQRRLSSRHGVLLIPKRLFVAVLTGEDATVDSVHLARKGHEKMAALVWGLIQNAY
jgi:acyl-CoA thioesterase I